MNLNVVYTHHYQGRQPTSTTESPQLYIHKFSTKKTKLGETNMLQ